MLAMFKIGVRQSAYNPSKTEVIWFGIRFDTKTQVGVIQLFETVTRVTVSKS